MNDIEVHDFNHADRPALLRIIEDPDVAELYYRSSSYGRIFTAWFEDRLVGFTHVNLDSDLHQAIETWTEFDLPAAPHAYLIRIHVDPTLRAQGIGTILIAHLASVAEKHGCRFIGALLDRNGDMSARRGFFARSGFTVTNADTVGAAPAEVLAATGDRG